MPWISRKKLAALKVAAAPFDGNLPYVTSVRVDAHQEAVIEWPDGCDFVPISRHVLTGLVGEANAYRRVMDPTL